MVALARIVVVAQINRSKSYPYSSCGANVDPHLILPACMFIGPTRVGAQQHLDGSLGFCSGRHSNRVTIRSLPF